MCLYDDPVFDDGCVDWAAIDRENEERDQWLGDTFWWLSHRERRDFLRSAEGYPGDHGDYADLRNFAASLRHKYSRRIPCKFELGFMTVSGEFDLVGGHAYLVEDGRYKLAEDFNGQMNIELMGNKALRIYNAEMFYGTYTKLDKYDLERVIHELDAAKKLPALRKI